MKKMIFFAITTILYSYVLVLSGCSVDTALPPPTSTGGGGGTVGAPQTVTVTLGATNIANGGSTTVTAVVRDSSSAVVPNATVSFSVINAGTGTFNPLTAVTDASGVATSLFTAVAPDTTATIRATAGTISGTAQITIGTPPQVPASIIVSLTSTTIASSGNTTVSATVRDALGVVISGVNVTFSVDDVTAGVFAAGTVSTIASGVATDTFTANAVNALVRITATVGSLNNYASLTIGTPPPPAAATMNLTASPTQITILGQSTISVTLLSSSGAPAFNTPVTISITGGQTLGSLSTLPSVTTVNATTDLSGNASATFTADTSSGVVSITASSGSLSKTVSIVITSAPASITLTIIDTVRLNGEKTTITALVRNAANEAVDVGTTVTFTMTFNGTVAPGTLSSTTAFTVDTGEASVTFTADPVVTGPVFITASAGTLTTAIQVIQVNPAGVGSLLFVSAEPQIIGISGSGTPDTSIVTFQVLNSVGGALANKNVSFSLAIGPVGATLTASGSTGADGMVSAILRSGSVAGPVRVVANTVVDPGPPAVMLSTSSGNISIGGGVPSDKWLSVSASKLNIDGLGCDGVETTINAMLADRFGNYNILEGTSVSFAAEGGAINTSNITDDQGRTSVVFRSQAPRPADGRISVLVMTTGEENFFDSNANGVFDGLDSFTDIPEPFIDSNEIGGQNSGELFFDWPLSVPTSAAGIYNNANLVWDVQIPIYRNITILLTGPPVDSPIHSRIETSTGGTGVINLGNGGSQVFTIYVSDINGNAPKSGTTVSIKASKGTLSTSSVTIPDTNGVGPYRFNVRLTGPSCTTAFCPQETGTLDADISWTGTACGGTVTVPIFYPGAITIY